MKKFIFISLILVNYTDKLFTQILIDPNMPKNPSTKQGYFLIFEDEFIGPSLDEVKWDKATADPADDVDCGFYRVDNMLNQVSQSNGLCVIKVEQATTLNSNCPIDPNCPGGVGGEIKTTEWWDPVCQYSWVDGNCFQSYNFPVGSYIEIRAKTSKASCGSGSSFWLYSPGEQEIDVFETSGDEDDFTSGLWSSRTIKGKFYDMYQRYRSGWDKFWGLEGQYPKIVSCGFSMKERIYIEKTILVWDESSGDYIEQTVSEIIPGNDIDPSETFLTYGVQFTEDFIEFFVNNVKYFSYDLNSYDFKGGELLSMRPKTIRLSAGQLTGGGQTPCFIPCPSQMEIDYVRTFLPSERNAIFWTDNQTTMCRIEEINISATYLAGLTYEWVSSAFDFIKPNQFSTEAIKKVKVKSNIIGGQKYPITLNVTFPDGHTESISRELFVSTTTGVTPPLLLSINCDPKFCSAEIEESHTECGCSEPNKYEWSIDNGSWSNFGTYYTFRNNSNLEGKLICVRTKNCNGISASICEFVPSPLGPRINKNFKQKPSVQIYPNPIKDYFSVSNIFPIENVKIINYLTILNINGSQVKSFKDIGVNSRIDISDLSSGMYLLKVNQIECIKFIKL
ncbi:MAG: T9SS type A sorting domain-containing protein [Saprospiraceae bacterium]|nr:T9SS type A sorting domain-containing protein [Saprospiraceae bacterium]